MTVRYAIIKPDGELTHHEGEPEWGGLFPDGRARVHLPGLAVAGWVSDIAKGHPRNPVGSCVLACFNANVKPYAGSVVFTGWNPDNTPLGLIEIEPLPEHVAVVLETVHGEVLKALSGQTPRELSASWAEQMREIAEHARTAPTPGLTIRTVKLR